MSNEQAKAIQILRDALQAMMDAYSTGNEAPTSMRRNAMQGAEAAMMRSDPKLFPATDAPDHRCETLSDGNLCIYCGELAEAGAEELPPLEQDIYMVEQSMLECEPEDQRAWSRVKAVIVNTQAQRAPADESQGAVTKRPSIISSQAGLEVAKKLDYYVNTRCDVDAIYMAVRNTELRLHPAQPTAEEVTGGVVDKRTDAEVVRQCIKRYGEFMADTAAQLLETPFKEWAAAKYPVEYKRNMADWTAARQPAAEHAKRAEPDWITISDGPPIPAWYAKAIYAGWAARSGNGYTFDQFLGRYPKFLSWDSMCQLYRDRKSSNGTDAKQVIDAAIRAALQQQAGVDVVDGELVQLRAQNMLLLGLYDTVAKLVKAKGRFHTEQNYGALVAAYDLVRTANASAAAPTLGGAKG